MTDRRALVVLVVIHLAIVAIVQPRGEFPLNDDWAFAHGVQWSLAEGRIRLSNWVWMNLVPQTVAGAAVSAFFGFSFEALRHLTQAVALTAMGVLYAWFRETGLEPRQALVATVAVAAFPAWPPLANSFMTDVYGLGLAVGAAVFFARALREPTARTLAVATALAIAGVLQRQVVYAIPFAFAAALFWTRRPVTARTALAGTLPFALCVAAHALFHGYLQQGPGVPDGQRVAHGRVMPLLFKALANEDGAALWVASNFATMAGYLGLFASGWLAWWGMRGASRGHRVFVIGGGIAIASIAFAAEWFPPYRPMHVLDRAGIGPLLLFDSLRGADPLDRSAGFFWSALAIPAGLGTAALALAAWRAIAGVLGRADRDPVLVFCIAVLAAYLAPFVATDYFDRYLLFVLPFIFAAWSRLWPAEEGTAIRKRLAMVWIAAAIALSSLATRDYFSWNRARWDAIRMAERLGATPETLDGGFEYNGHTRFERLAVGARAGKNWWWVMDDAYAVAFAPVPGYRVVETWRVPRVLPRSPSKIFLLQRLP